MSGVGVGNREPGVCISDWRLRTGDFSQRLLLNGPGFPGWLELYEQLVLRPIAVVDRIAEALEAVPFEEAEGARRGDAPHCTCLLPGCVVQTSLDDERSNTGSAMTMVYGDPVQPPGGRPITVRHWLRVDRSDGDLFAVAVGSYVAGVRMLVTGDQR